MSRRKEEEDSSRCEEVKNRPWCSVSVAVPTSVGRSGCGEVPGM